MTPAEQIEGIADASADVLTTRAVLAYIADKAAAVKRYDVLVDFRQDLRAHGKPPERSSWYIGLENPKIPGNCWAGLAVNNHAIATSLQVSRGPSSQKRGVFKPAIPAIFCLNDETVMTLPLRFVGVAPIPVKPRCRSAQQKGKKCPSEALVLQSAPAPAFRCAKRCKASRAHPAHPPPKRLPKRHSKPRLKPKRKPPKVMRRQNSN